MSLWLWDVGVEVASASERVLFSIDVPRSGATVYGDQLEVTGWAFALDGSVCGVEVEVPGRGTTRVTAAQPRDDVAGAYPQFPHAGRSGFALLASVPRIERTEVAVWVLVGGERVGAATIRLAGRARERWSGVDAPLVSVVIPCYNQARFLGEAIASVLNQTYPRVELIVVDDGSSDDTSAVAASLGVRCIREENRGPAAAKNRGAAAASGEYLIFLDADDRLLPHGLEANVDALAERPEAALVSGWFRYLTSPEEPLSYPVNVFENERNELVGLIPPPIPTERDHYEALLGHTYYTCAAAVMCRREVFCATGGFDGSYAFAEDAELYFRLARAHPMVAHSVPMYEYRRHPGTHSRDAARMLEWSLKMLRAQRAWVERDDALRAAYRRGAAFLSEFWGEQAARDLKRAVRGRDWRAAGRDAWVLARRYPRGLAHAIRAPRQPASEKRVLAWAHRVERLRGYLRTLRVLLGQTSDEVRARRVELAGHLTRLETLASAQLDQLEKLTGAAEAARSAGPGDLRAAGGRAASCEQEAADVFVLFDVEVEVASASARVMFSIDVPRSGMTVYGDQLEVGGWAFALDGSVCGVEVEVPGRGTTRVTAAQPRDDVAGAYPQFPHAGRSGFALLASVPRIERTEATVSILRGGERVGAATIRLAGRARERWSGADAPLVSVVIPCYNQAHFLGEAIASVLNQTYPRVELIVVDDGSSDDTSAVAASLGVRCIRQENRGLAAARNRGAAAASGEYLIFLDADDRLLPHGVEANVDALAERPEAALVAGWCRYLTSADDPLPYAISMFENERNELVGLSAAPTPPERDHYKALLENSYYIVCPASVMYRREVFRAAGGFNASYPGTEDYDLYLRLAREQPMVAHSVPIAEYRRYPGSMSRNSGQMLESGLATWRAQRAWVERDDALRAAYKRGTSVLSGYYGEQLARDLRRAVRGRDWRAAGRDAWVLARRYPRGLAHAIRAPRPLGLEAVASEQLEQLERLTAVEAASSPDRVSLETSGSRKNASYG